MAKEKLPYGLWASQVSPAMIGGGIRINDVQFSPDGKTLIWSQSQDGKTTLFAQQGNDAPWDLSSEYNPSGAVGYGGGDFVRSTMAFILPTDGRSITKAIALVSGLHHAAICGCAAPVPVPTEILWFMCTL